MVSCAERIGVLASVRKEENYFRILALLGKRNPVESSQGEPTDIGSIITQGF